MSQIQFAITIPLIMAVFYFGFKLVVWIHERKEK
jgi:hypothetical protein